tara:strand:- start:337 stop:966 length:630 start_codon:yes stop_codon:yes gene_type:complete
MSTKRTTKQHMENLLNKNLGWNVLDLACGRTAGWPQAQVLMDIHNWSDQYPGKKFIQYNVEQKLPFEDNEFDFVVASHIIEHVNDPIKFCKELSRVSKRGYIEVPTPLIDNLVSGDAASQGPLGHKWWVFFDDADDSIVFRPKRDVLKKMITIPELNKLYPFFRQSFVTEIYWEDEVGALYGDEIYSYEDKVYDLKESQPNPWFLSQGG